MEIAAVWSLNKLLTPSWAATNLEQFKYWQSLDFYYDSIIVF